MEGMLSASDQQRIVSSFLEIAVGQTAETARQFLQATSWKLDDAIQLFYVGSDAGAFASAPQTQTEPSSHALADQSWGGFEDIHNGNVLQNNGDEVRPPLPVVRETLYDDAMLYGGPRTGNSRYEPNPVVAFRNFSEETENPRVWESDQGTSATRADAPQDNLASLYRPPFHLMFHGSFEQAKASASAQDKWLLVNLQSTTEFSSHMLNRDTWANEAVSQLIGANFIFWQVYEDTTEGRKVCTYYKLESIPVVLVIDPTTGQKMRLWRGMVEPETLLEDLVQFMDGGPSEHLATLSKKRPRGSLLTPHGKPKVEESNDEDEELQRALAVSLENMKESSSEAIPDKKDNTVNEEEKLDAIEMPTYPPLPEEPKGERNLLCRVGVRLPDGRRVQRSFFKTDPIQLLWSFCMSQLEEGDRRKPFKLTHAIPGASKSLDFDANLTFEESGLANSMISVTWG